MVEWSDSFYELDDGAMLTTNQAAAALANISVYCSAFAVELNRKARERGITDDDMYAMAALQHIVDISSHAAVKYADKVGATTRQHAFAQNLPAMWYVMNAQDALELKDDVREMVIAGAFPVDPPAPPSTNGRPHG
jgi:hypothetical protein